MFRFVQRAFRPMNRSASALCAPARFEMLEGRQYWSASVDVAPDSAALTPTPGTLDGLTLYNAVDDVAYGALQNFPSISHVGMNTWGFTVKAETSFNVGSIVWGFDGDDHVSTENYAPFSIAGDINGSDMQPFPLSQGAHTITATAFAGKDGFGTRLGTITQSFTVTDSPNGNGAPVVAGPVVNFSDKFASASEQGLDSGSWVISRTGSTASALTVHYNTSGTAISGTDYDVLDGTLVIPAGSSSATLTVQPKQDTIGEGTETVVVTLAPDGAYTLGEPSVATCPIADNDSTTTPTPTPTTPTPTPTPTSGQAVNDITWSRSGPRAPEPKTEAGVIQVGSKIYSIGGFTATGGTGSFFPLTRRVYSYDMATRQYKNLASLPSSAAGNHMGVATDGQNIYTVAGQIGNTYGQGTNTVWKYNIAANTWTQFKSLPEIRFGGAAFVINGVLHFVAGDKADRETPTADHWAINLSDPNASWVRKASLPRAADHLSHATINGKVYLFGGEHGHHGLGVNDENGYIQHNNTYQYDPATDTWTSKASLPQATSHIEGSTLVINGQAVLMGGLLDGGSPANTNKVQVYDPVTNTWKVLNTRFPKRFIGAASGYWNGKIYLSEGYSPDETDRQVGFEGTVRFG